ncbi:MAG TPA: FAD-binding protein [Acetivibrio sp.]|uniref:FAD-binding protein n=1 Tax=Acetivibrio sp. TaxID=1872092 RepID=UPI002BE28CD3|nr:FAD-binding protein [Acetivibrio sp.]HOM02592.1 FAD-binding protein [Acetivibrio sp.]
MIIKENEELKKYTSIKIGGIANKFYIPESIEELVELLKVLDNPLVISGGSNLLIDDKGKFESVICLREFNKEINNLGDGVFYFGASVHLQKAILEINKAGYGGIEYLYSVPGLIGGAIYMNAGRGYRYNQSISDYIVSVDVVENREVKSIPKDLLEFKYRYSSFQDDDRIIVGAKFKFPRCSSEETSRLRDERIKLCKKEQDNSAANFGTVFCIANPKIMKLVSKLGLGRKDGVHFSKKTPNWILNEGNGNFHDTIQLIKIVQRLHKFTFQKCKLEVKIWR